MKFLLYTFISLSFISCQTIQEDKPQTVILSEFQKYTPKQDSIIKICSNKIREGKISLYDSKRQEILSEGLDIDSSISYLWQQKAMPLYKQGKYELGLPFLDKAVKFNRREYLPYRAFMQCIFAKNYKAAIIDFEKCIAEHGNLYEMDHTYSFYIALSYLQLNEFEKAEKLFKEDINSLFIAKGEDWVHHIDLFYYGISLFEQSKYEEAIIAFDKALNKYPEFSDAQFYKSESLSKLGDEDSALKLFERAKENAKLGYTINDDNTMYERYPYQIRW